MLKIYLLSILFDKRVLSVTSKYNLAQVVKSVDTRDLKSLGCKAVRVQVPPWAPYKKTDLNEVRFFIVSLKPPP